MTDTGTDNTSKAGKSCGSGGGFNYCRFSKIMVSIALFPMVAWIVSSFFASVLLKVVASALAIGGLIAGAIWIDRLPSLSGKIPALICKGKQTTNLSSSPEFALANYRVIHVALWMAL